MPLPTQPSLPSWATNGGFCSPTCSESSGFTILWHRSQDTPPTSFWFRPEPSVGVERPLSQPSAVWQRMHRSPTPSKSCSATATVAQKKGSRVACAIMLPRQLKAGSTAAS